MVMKKLFLYVLATVLSFAAVSCQNSNDESNQDIIDKGNKAPEISRMLDQIPDEDMDLHRNTVYNFLIKGGCDDFDNDIFCYSDHNISWVTSSDRNMRVYSSGCANFICYKHENSIVIDTCTIDGFEFIKTIDIVKSGDKKYYLLDMEFYVVHQGVIYGEEIYAFSIDGGKLKHEKLFRTAKKSYDRISVQCGGQRWLPLNYNNTELIYYSKNYNAVYITEVNERDWPTGRGLKYEWNGQYFKYVGMCNYDATSLDADYSSD